MTRQQEALHTQWATPTSAHSAIREKPPSAIEITGLSACSGKTQLLYYLVANAVLPAELEGTPLGEKEQTVVVVDLSGSFSILRLRDIMTTIIAQRSSFSDDQTTALIIRDSLMHLHVFRPQSTSSLLATLASLSDYLLEQPSKHHSSNRVLGMLAIKDLSSFLWQDRLNAEDAADPAVADMNMAGNAILVQRYRDLVAHLRRIYDLFSCTIVATNWGLSPTTSMMGQPALRPHLPAVWNNFCTVKIVVERDGVSKFSPGMSVEEAKAESDQRWEAVEQNGFSAWVNWWGSEDWRDEVKEAVKRLGRGRRFTFKVTSGGCFFEDECS